MTNRICIMESIEKFEQQQSATFSRLAAIEADCWQRIVKGSVNFKDDFHQPVTGTVCSRGINLRTVVLRKVWPDKKQLSFHTDIRSGKLNDLKNNPAISWLFYSHSQRVQIRMGGIAHIHTDSELATTAWANTKLASRKNYLTTMPPGTASLVPTDGISIDFANRDPDAAESEMGRKHFAVVATDVNWMEWLWLNHKGHRRALFQYNGTDVKSNWLIP
jgi:pyridoxamine 5'-phosphate oxidase